MTTHELKIAPGYYEDVRCGLKRVEVRKNDRGFRVGDVLTLRKWSNVFGYSGQAFDVRVTHVLSFQDGLTPGYVALSIELISPERIQ